MKRLIISVLLVLILFAFSIGSCKKDHDPVGNLKLMVQAPWKYIKFEQAVEPDPYHDQYPSWPSCQKDDQFVFFKDFSYQVNEGETKCNSTDPQVFQTGTWTFSPDQTKLIIDGDETTIAKLTDDSLILTRTESPLPDVVHYRYTYIH